MCECMFVDIYIYINIFKFLELDKLFDLSYLSHSVVSLFKW